jgi:hypothetical protein
VDLGDLSEEREHLASFLNTKLKIEFSPVQNKLVSDSETASPQDLERVVNKFIYHRNLNGSHWVSLDKNTVKINAFKNKEKKPDKQKKGASTPSTITHGWL